jgi:hypothetical protein
MRALLIMVQVRPLVIFISLLTGVLLCLHTPNQAEATGSFVERLDEAIRRVEAASERGTSLGDPGGLFPETEEVMGPGGSVRVDHTSLREEWSAVPAGGTARRESLERLRHRLVAVRAEMTSTEVAAGAGASPPTGWREKLSGVMGRPEFKKRQLEEDWRVRLVQWLREKLGFLLPRGTTEAIGSLMGWILYGLAGVTLAVVLFVLVRAALPLLIRDRSAPQGLAPSVPRQAETQETLLALADARTRAGDLRGAVQAIFRWMLLGLHRSGRLEYDPALTNREHLTRLKDEGGVRATFEQLSSQFELIWYGFHPIALEELAVFRAECQHLAGGRA